MSIFTQSLGPPVLIVGRICNNFKKNRAFYDRSMKLGTWLVDSNARILRVSAWIIKLPGLASYLFYQYHCLRVNWVYAEINTFLPPYSKRLFIAMIHRKVFNIKIVNIHFKWRKFLRNIRE